MHLNVILRLALVPSVLLVLVVNGSSMLVGVLNFNLTVAPFTPEGAAALQAGSLNPVKLTLGLFVHSCLSAEFRTSLHLAEFTIILA